MENLNNSIRDGYSENPIINGIQKSIIIDSYTCSYCSIQPEILSINDKDNTITFKCLNNNENHKTQTIPINEYINKMKNNTYLFSKCSICEQKQNEYNDTPIFSYCIKCDKIICFNCINEHIKNNEENHQNNINKNYIIKNNEKEISCAIHPNKINKL